MRDRLDCRPRMQTLGEKQDQIDRSGHVRGQRRAGRNPPFSAVVAQYQTATGDASQPIAIHVNERHNLAGSCEARRE